MDRNTFTGLFLIMVILGAAVFFMKPSEADIKKERERVTADSLKKTGAIPANTSTTGIIPIPVAKADSVATTGPFGANINGAEALTVIENELLKLTFTNVGGKIKSVEVKNEKTYAGKPVILFNGNDNKFGLNLNIDGKIVNTNNLYFTSIKNGNSMNMRANYSADKYIEFVYDLKDASRNVSFNVNLNGLNGVLQGNTVSLNWEATLLQQEKSAVKEQEHASPYYKYIEQNPDI